MHKSGWKAICSNITQRNSHNLWQQVKVPKSILEPLQIRLKVNGFVGESFCLEFEVFKLWFKSWYGLTHNYNICSHLVGFWLIWSNNASYFWLLCGVVSTTEKEVETGWSTKKVDISKMPLSHIGGNKKWHLWGHFFTLKNL